MKIKKALNVEMKKCPGDVIKYIVHIMECKLLIWNQITVQFSSVVVRDF